MSVSSHEEGIHPVELREYFEWILEEFDGSLVEGRAGVNYHVEITRLEETDDGDLRAVEGANVPSENTEEENL